MYSKESGWKLAYPGSMGAPDDDHAANHENEVKGMLGCSTNGGHFLLEVPLAY